MAKEALKITVGCDPEFFFYSNINRQYEYPRLIPGDKSAPYVVKDGAIQVDGLAMELNITPADNEEQWITRLNSVYQELENRVKHVGTIQVVPTATFTQQHFLYLENRILELGCTPDFNAYTGEINPRPNRDKPDHEQYFRSAGGHIHIGWRGPRSAGYSDEEAAINDKNHILDCFEVVRQMDFYTGVPSLFWDKDQTRRKLYGRAGACRVKPYGVEYRTLSNQWFKSEELQRFIYQNSIKAVTDLYNGKNLYEQYGTMAALQINGEMNVSSPSTWLKQIIGNLPEKYLPVEVVKEPKKKKTVPTTGLNNEF